MKDPFGSSCAGCYKNTKREGRDAQYRRRSAHGSSPYADGGDAGTRTQVLHHALHVQLLVVTERYGGAVAVAAATEVEREHGDAVRQQQLDRIQRVACSAASHALRASDTFRRAHKRKSVVGKGCSNSAYNATRSCRDSKLHTASGGGAIQSGARSASTAGGGRES